MRNNVRVVPYAHTQHSKVPKHFVYIQYGFVIQSEACCSTLHGVGSTPVISKSHPRPAEMYHCKGGPTHVNPQHIKRLKHFVYVSYGCGMHFTGDLSLNHVIITSHGLSCCLPQIPDNPTLLTADLTFTGITM